jgi:hypothetical protein
MLDYVVGLGEVKSRETEIMPNCMEWGFIFYIWSQAFGFMLVHLAGIKL